MTEMGTTPPSPSTAVSGPVALRIPAEPALSRIARLAASGLASLTGFTIDDIEDIKIAVSEVTIALVEHGAGQPVELEFDARDAFVVRARTAVEEFDPEHPDLELCRTVLGEVCKEHGMSHVDGHAEIWASVVRTG
ncbi:MAG: ATP-binding protein [Actinobacteria bacterium]|nr:ATP-binding protein [Actinomycetota bacterium]